MNFEKYKNNIEIIQEWLQKEFSGIRTGAASAVILDAIKVEVYGSLTPLNQVASIGIEGTQTLAINPFDNNQIGAIQKALTDSNLGLLISVAGSTIRLSFPELTIDRKKMLIKLAKEKIEEAKISIRKSRDEVKNEIEQKQKDSEITEDEKFSLKKEMEEITQKANSNLEDILKLKEEEIEK